MSSDQGEAAMKAIDDKASYDRLQKDVEAVKADISKLAGEISDTLNDLAGATRHEARRKYNKARRFNHERCQKAG